MKVTITEESLRLRGTPAWACYVARWRREGISRNIVSPAFAPDAAPLVKAGALRQLHLALDKNPLLKKIKHTR